MPDIRQLIAAMEAIAPPELAEGWDNTGLLLGDPDRAIDGPILLTIDLTEKVAGEAVGAGAAAVVAYHPPIFKPLDRLTARSPRGRALLGLAAARIAVYSPHTALDAAEGGVNDWLLELAAGGPVDDRRALRPALLADPTQSHKLITFMPRGHVDGVRAAMSAAGAGVIGEYTQCAFGVEGAGSFFGSDETNPAVGESGRLERVEEVRLEMVCPARALAAAIEALRSSHPYEEPAFDVLKLEARPSVGLGAGRSGRLADPTTADGLADRLRRGLGVDHVRVARAGSGPIGTIGVCPGAGGSLVGAAMAAGCDAFITGEMRHHDVLDAVERGLTILLAGHTNTERGYLHVLAERLRAAEGSMETLVSAADRWPFE